jgi:Uma2 family endonuclease
MVHVHMDPNDPHGECFHLPRDVVRYPVELRIPPNFCAEEQSTWPSLDGRLEYVDGRVLYLPPCGAVQQYVYIDLGLVLASWARSRDGFLVGGNEAGMLLGADVRGADAAIWRASDPGRATARFQRTPPVLAVEVAGLGEDEPELREKARWYLDAGVEVVWLVLPDPREVVVLSRERDVRCRKGERLSEHPSLPGLAPEVDDFFRQLDKAG